ncbi:MAG: mechanosensitive ion channel [Planctomycetes bacterium]|nr:mechanosensitive ion channel [Planctomycetota bacterium]HRV81039.1 mechanosensitive ion channel [Planctomycetota bacterium]
MLRNIPIVLCLFAVVSLGLALDSAQASPQDPPISMVALEGGQDAAVQAPRDRKRALTIPVEVLKAELRPMRKEAVAGELQGWLSLLQTTCEQVRDVEVAALQATDPAAITASNAKAVELRGERTALIKRVSVVISALEAKGGEVTEARDYLGSVVASPPITGWRAAWATIWAWMTNPDGGLQALKRMGTAIGILVGFWFLAKILTRLMRRATRSLPHASELLREFLADSTRRLTILIGVLIALSTLGINMTPLVAAIGAAGLVIGLALQGTLGNLASGLMIMIYRPFDTGDFVSMSGVSGVVHGMTLMTTEVRTADNQTIHVPNNKIWGDVVTNVTANSTRRVDLTFGISYDDDIDKAKAILLKVAKEHPSVLKDPEPNIRLHQLADSSVNLILRPWANTSDYWVVYWELTEAVKKAFDREGITIPYPQRDVHMIAPTAGESA